MSLANKLKNHPKTAAILLGALAVLALPPYYVFPVLFISFASLLWLLNRQVRFKTAFALGYWFGFAFFGLGFSWASNALLIDAASYGWLYPISLLASGTFFGLFTAFPAALTVYFKSPAAKLFAFAAFWTLSEWLRSFVLTGFPWNLLGSILAFRVEFLQTATIWGTYGLSLLIILFSAAPFLFSFHRRSYNFLAASLLFGIPLLLSVFGFWRLNHYRNTFLEPGLSIRMVQPSIPQEMKWNRQALENNLQKYIELSRQPGLDKIDFVIWGETATPFPLDIDPEHLQQVRKAVPEKGFLVTGVVRYEFTPYSEVIPYNSMFIIDSKGEIVDYYDKSHLVPFGEYIPLRQYLPSWIKPLTNTVANFQPGNGPKTINLQNYPQLSGLICYEIIFPSQVADKKNPPHWLINLTNDGWYGNSAGPYQHLVTTQLRAVEEGRSIVRVANSGISAAIDPLGRLIEYIPLNHYEAKDVILPSELYIFTIYSSCGNSIPLILCFLNIILAFYFSLRKF